MKKRKDIKNNKTQEKTSKKEKCTNKVRESLEGNGVDYEEELKKSKKLEIKLKKATKWCKVCVLKYVVKS